jgi:hypothetical protein
VLTQSRKRDGIRKVPDTSFPSTKWHLNSICGGDTANNTSHELHWYGGRYSLTLLRINYALHNSQSHFNFTVQFISFLQSVYTESGQGGPLEMVTWAGNCMTSRSSRLGRRSLLWQAEVCWWQMRPQYNWCYGLNCTPKRFQVLTASAFEYDVTYRVTIDGQVKMRSCR